MYLIIDDVGGENFSLCLSRFFGWSNYQINKRQIKRRKINLITYITIRDPQGVMQLRLLCHPELGRKGVGVWDFKGKENN